MCGIAGFTNKAQSVDSSVVQRMTGTIVHRGPDQQGYYVCPDLALGAVRLQVIDIEGGEQPFRTADGRFKIAYNGEIYNYRELRQDLEKRGHRFRSHSDTEVALKAFAEWGADCFARFRGMFAMAIWSETDRRLFLARDHMGIKPLYVTRCGQDIVFGSELKALFEHPGVRRVLDLEGLDQFLSLGYVPSPRTLVRGIEKLPSGHYLEWHNGETRLVRYWQLKFAPDHNIREKDASAELDDLMRSAVREQMVSDVPLGVWASGGIDSSAILHYAARLSPQPVKTFSISFESRSCDESPYFRQMAERYGTDHYEFHLSSQSELLPAIEEFAYYSDEPGADAGALPVWFLSKMSRRHVTVALSGEGGDELFGGYLTYRADQVARPLRLLPRALRHGALMAARRVLPVSNAKIGLEYKIKRLLEGSLLPADEAHLFWNGSFSRGQKQALLAGLKNHSLGQMFNGLPDAGRIGFLNRYMMLDQKYYLQDNLLYKVDRMSMAHSLEVRPPFLDHRIVEFAARLPQNLKIGRGTLKRILRRTMKDKLPENILTRGKSGLDIPAHEWFRGPLQFLLRETLNPSVVRETGLFDENFTERLMMDHRERRINAGYHLWTLLTLFLWLKRWKIEVAPAEGRIHSTWTSELQTPDSPAFATAG